jgi:ABC-2 type transport system permease protein
MHNIWLIAKREYNERIRTRSFIIATILIPVLMGGLVFGSSYIGSRSKVSAHIAVVSSDRAFATDLQQQLETGEGSKMQVDVLSPSSQTRTQLNDSLHNKSSSLAGYLWVTPAAAPGARPSFSYYARSAGDISTRDAIESGLEDVLMREGLSARGLPASEIASLMEPVKIDTSSSGNTQTAFFAAYMLFFLMYMVIMLYGMNTARSIIEEKTSRVFEVLLATIRPEELLAGKILGVGAVGLTQIGIWMLAAVALSATSLASSLFGANHVLLTGTQIGFFILYFLFGFLLYSSIAAALGAMTNSEQELQQLNMFLVLPLAFCFVMQFSIIRAPNSPLARVVSLIPFCSPLLMNFRISLTEVPSWEIWLSIVLMSLTIVAILWISSRIYRVGILMYGKKPNLPEIMRWLKYS